MTELNWNGIALGETESSNSNFLFKLAALEHVAKMQMVKFDA